MAAHPPPVSTLPDNSNLAVSFVPEPASIALLGAGLLGLRLRRRTTSRN